MVQQALKGGIWVDMLFLVDGCGAKSAVLDVGFAVPVYLLRISVVDTCCVRNGPLDTSGEASPQSLGVLAVCCGMQFGRVDMNLLIHCYVYAVCDLFLAELVVDVVVVAVKCGFVLDNCVVVD